MVRFSGSHTLARRLRALRLPYYVSVSVAQTNTKMLCRPKNAKAMRCDDVGWLGRDPWDVGRPRCMGGTRVSDSPCPVVVAMMHVGDSVASRSRERQASSVSNLNRHRHRQS